MGDEPAVELAAVPPLFSHNKTSTPPFHETRSFGTPSTPVSKPSRPISRA
jgi:hypothetical protein